MIKASEWLAGCPSTTPTRVEQRQGINNINTTAARSAHHRGTGGSRPSKETRVAGLGTAPHDPGVCAAAEQRQGIR
jgi:hypothetical protein